MFAGIDIGNKSIVVCMAAFRPKNLRKFYREPSNFLKFDLNNIEDFKQLPVTNAFLEPTGGHYSRLWISLLERKGCSVFLIGHKELLSYRKYLDLPDKDDNADALALLCYGFDFEHEQPGRFLHRRDSDCALLRDYYFRLGFYSKAKTSLINRLRQDLSWQVPEIANISLSRKELTPIPLMVRWLSGEEESNKYDRFVDATIGEGLIADDTIFLAELLYDLFSQDLHIENQIQALLSLPKFEPYLEILKEFGMANVRTSAFMISQFFPLSQFLGPDGRPIIEKIKTDRGTMTTRRISEARFKSRMGAAPSREFSGQSKKFKKRGSSEARLVLWQWFRVRVEFGKMPDSDAGAQITTWWKEGRASGVPIKKLRAKCRSKAMGLLFRRLCKNLL